MLRPGLLLGCALLALALALATGIVAPSGASADGDPASDTLLVENVFYPYEPPTSQALQRELNGATAAAARARAPVRIALIASRLDLGAIPSLFGKPQEYADFLDQEISFDRMQPLLVVMGDGYGTQGLTPAARGAVAALPRPAGSSGDQLAGAALVAVRAIAAAEGHPLAAIAPATSSPNGGGSAATILIIGVIALLALGTTVALATVTLRRRGVNGARVSRERRRAGR